jgi:HD superfamily phosphohydrolase
VTIKTVKPKLIHDAIHGTIPYTSIEHEIISNYIFNRLHDILQNSLVFRVFPGDRISRFSHSIGVMHISSKIFFYSLANTDNQTLYLFYEKIRKFVKEYARIINDDLKVISPSGQEVYCAKEYISDDLKEVLKRILNPEVVLNYFIPGNVSDEFKPYLLFSLQSLRIASLLHDAGHLPLSHVFEYALDQIYKELESMHNNINEIKHLFESYKNFRELFSTQLKPHETLSIIIVLQLLGDKYKRILREMDSEEKCPAPLEDVYDAIVHAMLALSSALIILGDKSDTAVNNILEFLHKNNEYKINVDLGIFSKTLHQILDNEVDSDKIDYVKRASLYSGVKMSFNEDRIITTYRLVKDPSSPNLYILPAAKSLHEIEELHKALFRFYRNIIGHHRVMLLEKLLTEILTKMIRLYKYYDSLPDKYNDIRNYIKENYIQKLIRLFDFCNKHKFREAIAVLFSLDDAWIFSFLKNIYVYILTKEIRNQKLEKIEKELEIMLREIFENVKEIRPLWKHRSEYWSFIRSLFNNDNKINIKDINGKLRIKLLDTKETSLELQQCIENCVKKNNYDSKEVFGILIQPLAPVLRLPKLKGKFRIWTYRGDSIRIVHIDELSELRRLQDEEEKTHVQLYVYYYKNLNRRVIEKCTRNCIKDVLITDTK